MPIYFFAAKKSLIQFSQATNAAGNRKTSWSDCANWNHCFLERKPAGYLRFQPKLAITAPCCCKHLLKPWLTRANKSQLLSQRQNIVLTTSSFLLKFCREVTLILAALHRPAANPGIKSGTICRFCITDIVSLKYSRLFWNSFS